AADRVKRSGAAAGELAPTHRSGPAIPRRYSTPGVSPATAPLCCVIHSKRRRATGAQHGGPCVKSRYVVWRIESPSETSVEIRVEYVVCPVGRAPGPNGAVTAPVSPALPLAYAERIAALLERSAAGRTSRGRGRAAPEPQDPARRLRRRLRDAVEKVWAARRDRLLAHRAIAGFPELAGSPLPKLPSTS